MSDARRSAPGALRNRDAILAVLREELPAAGLAVEVASGSGEHVVHFARALPDLRWQPSDLDAEARASIAAWTEAEPLANVAPPLPLDATSPDWPIATADAMLCTNMVHISPWAATLGLLAHARRLLPPGGPLILYGPYRERDRPTAPSNEAFDQSLQARDPAWGLREVEAVVAAAEGFALTRRIEMPANNLMLVLRRT